MGALWLNFGAGQQFLHACIFTAQQPLPVLLYGIGGRDLMDDFLTDCLLNLKVGCGGYFEVELYLSPVAQ